MVGPAPSGNFGFLAGKFDDLYELLSEAEHCSLRDADDAGVRLRKFAELFVGHCKGAAGGSSSLHAGINELLERGRISAAEADALNEVRRLGNRAAHERNALSYEVVQDGLRHAHALAVWLMRREYDAEFVVTEFQAPRRAFTRLYQVAAERTGRVRYIGYASRRCGPAADVHELFVDCPLALDGEMLDAGRLFDRLREDPCPRVIILGDAGAGKTTLSRWLVHQLVSASRPCVHIPATDLDRQMVVNDCSVLAAVHAALCARHESQLSVEAFAHLWKDFRAMLLVDGLDELSQDSARARLGEALAAFGSDGNAVIVTSRDTGYDRTSLPGEFELVRLHPWADTERRSFLRLWFTQRELAPGDVQRRVDEICEAITSDPGANELAATPMLTTLIALLYEPERALPTQLTSLFERSIRTMLRERSRTRPGYRERDMDEQLIWLEHIAALIADRSLAVPITSIVEHLQRLGISGLPGPVALEDWLVFLVEQTGLLVEFDSDRLDFAHATLRDHLCARMLLREPEQLAEQILARAGKCSWMAPCVMALHGGPPATAAQVVEGLDLVQCWGFIELWAPNAELEPQVLTKLLETHARVLLEGVRGSDHPLGGWYWTHGSTRSLGHGDEVHRWLRQRIASARDEALREVVVLAAYEWPLTDAELLLRERSDLSAVAEELLEFWPVARLGAPVDTEYDVREEQGREFAAFIAAHVDDDAAARWAARIAPSNLLVAVFAVLTAKGTETLAYALLQRILAYEHDAPRAWLRIVDGPSIPMPARVRSRLGATSGLSPTPWARRRMLEALAHDQDDRLRFVLPEFALTPALLEHHRRSLLDGCVNQQLEGDFGWWLESTRELLPLRRDIFMLSACRMGPCTIDEMRARPRLDFVRMQAAGSYVSECDRGDKQRISIFACLNDSSRVRLDHHLQQVQAAELALGLLSTRDASSETCMAYAIWRLTIRWIAELWPAVEGCVCPLPVTTAKASLLLALAWAVEQVTGRWPDSELCIELATVGITGDRLFDRMQELVAGLGQRWPAADRPTGDRH